MNKTQYCEKESGMVDVKKTVQFLMLTWSVMQGPSGSLDDWGERVEPPRWGPLDAEAAAASRRHWHLVRCQNGKFVPPYMPLRKFVVFYNDAVFYLMPLDASDIGLIQR